MGVAFFEIFRKKKKHQKNIPKNLGWKNSRNKKHQKKYTITNLNEWQNFGWTHPHPERSQRCVHSPFPGKKTEINFFISISYTLNIHSLFYVSDGLIKFNGGGDRLCWGWEGEMNFSPLMPASRRLGEPLVDNPSSPLLTKF